jgi:hypothetical protein
MSDPHLTADQAARFHHSDLPIEELLQVLQHLDECLQCREQHLEHPRVAGALRGMEANLLLLTWEGDVHLSDEQIIACGEQTLNAGEQDGIALHLKHCTQCRARVERIRALHTLLMEEQERVVSPLPHVTLRDTTGSIVLQGGRVQFEGLHKLPAESSRWIAELLTEGVIEPAKSMHTLLTHFKHTTSPMPVLRHVPLALVAPVNTVVRSSHPQLRWSPIPDTEEYSVVVMQAAKRNSKLMWKGRMGKSTEGNLPPEVAIASDRLYLWQVMAARHGIETNSATAWFSILPAVATAEVEEIERECGDSALILFVTYEKYGLYADAKVQLDRLLELNPNSVPVLKFAQRLEQLRTIQPELV